MDTFKRPSGATGHRIALGGPLRPPDGHSGPAWSSPAPQAWFRGSAPAPSPFGFDALADGSIEPLPSVWPSRWAAAIAAFLASAVTPRTDHGAGRGPFWQFSASIKSLQRKQCIIKKWSTQAYQKAYQIRPSPLRRNGRCRLQAQSVLQPCPTGEVRGQSVKGGEAGSGVNPSHAHPAGRAWRGLRAPTL